jgi:hypothetical protein
VSISALRSSCCFCGAHGSAPPEGWEEVQGIDLSLTSAAFHVAQYIPCASVASSDCFMCVIYVCASIVRLLLRL